MPKPPKDDTPPLRFADTNPPPVTPQHIDFDYMQMIVEVHKSMARLEEKVSFLSERTKENGEELKKIGRKILAAEVALAVVGALLAFVGYLISNAVQIYVNTPHK